MKFGAKLLDAVNITHFTHIVATIGRLTAKNSSEKSCVLKLTSEAIYFILPEFATLSSGHNNNLGRTSFWTSIDTKSVFEFYVCESKPDDPEPLILLEIQPESLLRALKSTTGNIKMIRIKLTKRDVPCITVEIDLHSLSSRANSRTITHDIPVKVISTSRASLDDFQEPNVSRTTLSIEMPPLKLVKHMFERMKGLSEFVIMEANDRGELQFKIDADAVSVCSYFRNLANLPVDSSASSQTTNNDDEDAFRRCSVRLSLKRLNDFVNSLQFQPTKMICNFLNHKYAHFFVLHDDDLVLQFLLSSVLN